jgi:cytochrome c553
MKIRYILVIALFSMFTIACSHYEELSKNSTDSKSGDDESHNPGQDCGSCHNKSGSEAALEYWWTVAGTVFKTNGSAQKSATIELWTKPGKQGTMVKRLVTDDLGNFYTDQILNFQGGVYPVIITASDEKKMSSAFSGGSCNSCHNGSTQARLTIN